MIIDILYDLVHDIVPWLLHVDQSNLEVGNFHKHLPRGGYFLPKAMLVHVLFFSGHGTSRLHHSVSVSMRLTLPRACGPRYIV